MDKLTMTLQNNETLAYQSHHNDKKDVVLMIHGNMSSSVHYAPLVTYFKDYHVLIPDLRGFGDSTYHKPIESLEDLTDDLMDFLHLLNIKKVHIIGWSTGGGVGLKFASKYPSHIKTLTLIESASYKGYPIYTKDENFEPTHELYTDKEAMALDPVQVLPALKAMQEKNVELMKQIWQAAIYNVQTPDKMTFERNIQETLKQRNLVDIDWALMTFNMAKTPNGVAPGDGSIDDIDVPVLSIYGENDLVIPRYMFEETLTALKNAKSVVYKTGSHSPITDFPETLANQIIDFITSQ